MKTNVKVKTKTKEKENDVSLVVEASRAVVLLEVACLVCLFEIFLEVLMTLTSTNSLSVLQKVTLRGFVIG